MNRQLKKILFVLTVTLLFSSTIVAQKVAVKTNLLYGGTATPNLQLEFGLSKKSTLDVGGGLNWFDFSDNKKFKHLLVQPEYRYWFCESFNGHFLGVHAHGAQFNVGNWDIPVGRLDTFKDRRYEGHLFGGGLSWGYQWVVSPRWNIEVNLGGGYARIDYTKYCGKECGSPISSGKHNYWGVTRAGLSIVYFIK